MVFGKNAPRCENCDIKVKDSFSYCPNCGEPFIDEEQQEKDFGMLGTDDNMDHFAEESQAQNSFGITDKLIGSLMNSLMKNLDKQFKNMDRQNSNPNRFENAEIQTLPNGIKIKIGPKNQTKKKSKTDFFKKQVSDQQLKKMSSLPRTEAKTKVKRIGDKVVYELSAPGVESPQDVFLSKLESGYEIKAIGEKKVYVNTIPVNLPIRGFAIDKNKLFIEFISQGQFQ